MAAIDYYLANAIGDGWRLLTADITQPAATLADGWVVSTGATNHSEYEVGAERAASTFTGTTQPDGTLNTTLKDAFRSNFPLTGDFASANWVLHFVVRAVTNGGAQDGRIRFRLIKADADGSNATEITSGQQQCSIVSNVSTSADFDSTLTFNPGAFSISGQYLFFQIAWERTGAGGMTSSDILFRTGSSSTVGTRITTSDFTVGNTTTTKTITAKSAIRQTTDRTITAISRIRDTITQTIPARSRIMATVARTVTTISRIRATVARTISTKSRIGLEVDFLTDTFTDADGTDLTAHTGEWGATWATPSYLSVSSPKITNNRSRTVNDVAFVYASGVPPGADYIIEALFRQISDEIANAGVIVRLSTTEDSHYIIRYSQDGNEWQLRRTLSGSGTISLGTWSESLSNGDERIVKLVVSGDDFEVFIDGVSRITATNADITDAGRVALRHTALAAGATTGIHIDWIRGYTVASATVQQTVTTRSRIHGTATPTIPARSRITVTQPRTITAVSRIRAITTKTITAISSVAVFVVKNITAVSRVLDTVQKTITARSRIQDTVSQSIVAKSSIPSRVAQTIPAQSRIRKTVNQTIPSQSRITAITIRTITVVSRVMDTVLQTITSRSRVTDTVDRTIPARSRIMDIETQTIPARSRVRKTVDHAITVLSRITAVTAQTITSISNIAVIGTTNQTITAKSAIQKTATQTIPARSRIQQIAQATITTISRVQDTLDRTIASISRITETSIQTITSISNILVTSAVSQTITTRSRVTVSREQTIPARSRITDTVSKSIVARSRLSVSVSRAITMTSSITVPIVQTINAISRVRTVVSHAIQTRSRVQDTVQQTITCQSRIILPGDVIIAGPLQTSRILGVEMNTDISDPTNLLFNESVDNGGLFTENDAETLQTDPGSTYG